MCAVSSEIPRETVLETLLFILKIDELCAEVNHGNITLFADNAKVYARVRSKTDCLALNEDFLNILEWIN